MPHETGPGCGRGESAGQREVWPGEPYHSYGISVHEFFSSGSDRVFGDMTGVVNGNDLAAATREAIRRHPGPFVSSIASTIWQETALRPVYAPEPSGSGGQPQASAGQAQRTQYAYV